MAVIEKRLTELGIVLPVPMRTANLPFRLARVIGNRLVLAGHVPTADDGRLAQPLGKVGGAVTAEQGFQAARRVGLGLIATLKQTLGDLDRVTAWVKLLGMVNVAPGFTALPGVINGCSELILEVFGTDIGAHARSAVGMAALPFDVPVEIEGEVVIRL
jgi:enamine deaminase RidA (YjgF/YER057c/UK114 family)